MYKILIILISGLLLFGTGCVQHQLGVMKFANGVVQHRVYANEMPWKPCPPGLPAGCEAIAVLEGHPKKADLFTVRFKVKKGFLMPAHTHPKDERVTILSGKMSVAFGKDAKHGDATSFGSGDYYVNSRDAVHVVWADEDSILQITGIGPWEVNFLDQAH